MISPPLRVPRLASCLAFLIATAWAGSAAAADLAAAEPHGFSSRAEKAEVRLGEPFGYVVEVQHDPAESYDLPGALDLKPFQASGGTCTRTSAKPDEAVTRCTMRLALFDVGEHEIPDLTLVARTPKGDRLLRVPGARVTGIGMLDPGASAQDLELRDIAPPVPVMVRSWRLVAWGLGVLGGAALLAAGWILWRRLRRRSREQELPALLPHQRFERHLDALEAEALPRRGQGRAYFFRLSETVREYVGALQGVNALDLTTEEILQVLGQGAPAGLDRDAFARFCRQADLVKFARHEPAEGECAEAMAFARQLLEQTRPPPEPKEGPGKPAGSEAA